MERTAVDAATKRNLVADAVVEARTDSSDVAGSSGSESGKSEGLHVWIVKSTEKLVRVNRSLERGREDWRNCSETCTAFILRQARQVNVSLPSSRQRYQGHG